MKIIIQLYYLLYVLSGGYRHYLYEFNYFKISSNLTLDLEPFLQVSESLLFLLAIALLIKPFSKSFHLIFFILLFGLDLYFNNFVKFESAILGTHLFPLIAFLALSRFSKKKVQTFSVLLISIAFITTSLMKIKQGWLNIDNLVIYNHLIVFSEGYGLNTFLSPTLIQFKSIYFWKFLDYFVVVFQLSFLLNFFTQRFLAPQLLLAFFFHLGILFTLNIGVFFPYLLLYLLILFCTNTTVLVDKESIKINTIIIAFILGLSFFLPEGTAHFFLKHAPNWVYLYYEFFVTLFLFIFGMSMFYKYFNLKQDNLK